MSDNSYFSFLDSINKPVVRREGDYLGADGLLYCGKCRTQKQFEEKGRTLTCMCACETKERDREEAEGKRRELEALRERCIPYPAQRKCTFAASDNGEKHIETAREYVESWKAYSSDNIGLMFWGNTGTGKSFAALCIANALIDKGIAARFISAADIVAKMGENRDELLNTVSTVPLLIIDDIGAERDTEYSREQLTAVIDARLGSGKPLIVTTNLSLQEIKNPSDAQLQRIFSRLSACCNPVRVVGDDRRRVQGAENIREMKAIMSRA